MSNPRSFALVAHIGRLRNIHSVARRAFIAAAEEVGAFVEAR